MKTTDNRAAKLAALQSALEGNPQALLTYKKMQGRPYSEAEREEQRKYLTQLYGYEPSIKEVSAFFGRSEPVEGTSQYYILPSGMRLSF